jgi:tRNA-2-methylthio-N6-dimethylallyladenosine synthase
MKRFYSREDYLRLADELCDARSDFALSTDIILGFPGETDEDFEQTMSLLEAVRFHTAFSFKYSARPGTPALTLLDRGEAVPPEVAQARLLRYQNRQREISLELNQTLVGSVHRVLVEGPSRHDQGVICGRTSSFKMINFPGTLDQVGRVVDVMATRAFTHSLRGEQAGECGEVESRRLSPS